MTLRPLTTLEDCRQAAALEREVWDYADREEIPAPLLYVSLKRGGILIGAFDDEGRLIGVVHSVPGIKDRQLTHWSHVVAVTRAARGRGLGRRLKLAQRDAALALGVHLIEWTFDPLQAPNARFNFTTLGTVAAEYAEDVYGPSTSPLHRGTPTDRLVAEWHLSRPHVERRIASRGQPLVRDGSLASAVVVNPGRGDGGELAPGAADLSVGERRVLVEIPASFGRLLHGDPRLALAWRLHTREVFQAYFARGYRAVDFFLSRGADRGHYLLAREAQESKVAPGARCAEGRSDGEGKPVLP